MEKIIAKDKEHLKQLIEEEMMENGISCDLNHIDLSEITDLSDLFRKSKFNRAGDRRLQIPRELL